MLVDETIMTKSDFHSIRMTGRFVANNFFQNWFTAEFVQANNVNLEEYLIMPLYEEQICIRFHLTEYYAETL